ncbi:hypothetical protein OPV22_001491 [Ensete ventricosum]|uniref:PROP1-like PPR domain-containing protein n=1 Tax=Ensete ventricosum TaxID=4639 RepID=A0AAV8RWB5_ENSVE|nr:hypothetical protein OPV22_001491 [Ensete ventricosum]
MPACQLRVRGLQFLLELICTCCTSRCQRGFHRPRGVRSRSLASRSKFGGGRWSKTALGQAEAEKSPGPVETAVVNDRSAHGLEGIGRKRLGREFKAASLQGRVGEGLEKLGVGRVAELVGVVVLVAAEDNGVGGGLSSVMRVIAKRTRCLECLLLLIVLEITQLILFQHNALSFSISIIQCPMAECPSHLTVHGCEFDEFDEKEEIKLKWTNVGPDLTEDQRKAISQLPLKMSNRCKALTKHLICFSPDADDLPLLLAAWVKAMKPRRADWLAILKEIKRMENPHLFEVMEYALLENSFEANVRDYTKLIDLYAKRNLLENAENSFQAMQKRGFPCDQVTLTVLINMYSKAGHLDRAKEAFEEIKLLSLPVDKRAYGSMLMAYIRAEMLEHAEILMKEMEEQECYTGKEVYKALLRAYSTNGNADGAQRVFNSIQFAGIVPDSRLCALLINAYYLAGQSSKARSVFENMRIAGLEPSDRCIALMLGAYERENKLDAALSFLIELEHDGVLIAEEASQVLVGWFRRLGVVGEVQQVLREFAVKGAGSFTPYNACKTK